MTVAEMKLEAIKKIITTDDEAILQNILAFLEDTAKRDDSADLCKNYFLFPRVSCKGPTEKEITCTFIQQSGFFGLNFSKYHTA